MMKIVLSCTVALQAGALLLEPDTTWPKSRGTGRASPDFDDFRIHAAQHATFNVAFNGSVEEGGIIIGRFLQGKVHTRGCNYTGPRPRFYWDAFGFARWSPALGQLHFSPLKIPNNVVCGNVGEPKWVPLHGHMYVYSYGHGRCPESMYHHLPAGFKETYAESNYKNYLMKFDPDTATLSGAIVLATKERVDPATPTQKNFAFFTYQNETFAITVPCPHRVHKLDLSTGLMVPAYDSDCRLPHEYSMGMSADPLLLEDGSFLVAAHIRGGGWNGLRQSFFYKMEGKPPFNVLAHTPAFSFGYDDKEEYLTGLTQNGDKFSLSIGIGNCESVVMDISKSKILSRMVVADRLSRVRITPKDSREYRLLK